MHVRQAIGREGGTAENPRASRVSHSNTPDPRVQSLLAALLAFRVLPDGFQTGTCARPRHRSWACPWRSTGAAA